MKAIIAAGGRGTRFRPITWTRNKHLIPLANKPMIVHAIEKVKSAGITDIYLNVNPGDTEMEKALGDGSRYGVRLTHVEQQGGALGIGHVPKNAEAHIGDGPFMFYLGDNIIVDNLERFVRRFEEEKLNCLIAISKVKDPQRFGVPKFCADGSIECVIEKPVDPPSDFAVTGIYLFDQEFFKIFDEMKPSARGEYEITDIITWYIQHGKKVGHEEITGWWKDTGNAEALLEGNALIMDEMNRDQFTVDPSAQVHPEARLQGMVQVGKGTTIGADVLMRGPVIIGENCVIDSSFIGPYTSVGNGVTIHDSEIEHSVIFDQATIAAHARIMDSIIGDHAQVFSCKKSMPVSCHRVVIGDNSLVEL